MFRTRLLVARITRKDAPGELSKCIIRLNKAMLHAA